MHACMYACMYVCMYVRMYVCSVCMYIVLFETSPSKKPPEDSPLLTCSHVTRA